MKIEDRRSDHAIAGGDRWKPGDIVVLQNGDVLMRTEIVRGPHYELPLAWVQLGNTSRGTKLAGRLCAPDVHGIDEAERVQDVELVLCGWKGCT